MKRSQDSSTSSDSISRRNYQRLRKELNDLKEALHKSQSVNRLASAANTSQPCQLGSVLVSTNLTLPNSRASIISNDIGNFALMCAS